MAGMIRPNANKPLGSRPRPGEARADCAPAAAIVRVDDPALFVTVTLPNEQVGAGVFTGEMLQVSATPDGLSPPDGVIVMVDVTEAPGATDNEGAEDERVKLGVAIARLMTAEVLARKLASPL